VKRAKELSLNIITGILGSVFLISFILSVYYSGGNSLADIGRGLDKEPRVHFAAVLIGTEKQFLNAVEEGLSDKAEKEGVNIEIFRLSSVSEAAETIDMLVTASVDGIITQGIQEAGFLESLERAKEEEIPLILIASDDHTISRDGYVGGNPFEFGMVAASYYLEQQKLLGKVVFITQTPENADEDTTGKLQTQGFMDVFENRHRESQVITKKSDSTLLSAEGIVSDLFLEQSDISGIVCTNEVDTLGVVQVVIDLNQVGKVMVVGTGLTNQIAEYIEMGIIKGTLYRDPYTIGKLAFEGLYNYYTDDEAEWNYQDIPVTIITQENLGQYLQTEGGK